MAASAISRVRRRATNDLSDANLLESSTELLPGRLYFVVLRSAAKPKYTQNSHYFTVDDELKYDPFYEDFGPLNLSQLYHYCVKLESKLHSFALMEKKIVHYTSTNPQKRVNAAYLIGSYAVLYLKMSPSEVYQKLTSTGTTFLDFRDASVGFAMYTISLLDCLNAIAQARKMNFFDFADFNAYEYEHFETVENGDLNWIVPSKFLAFAGPQSLPYSNYRGASFYSSHPPESYINYFIENEVTTVVRLNNKLYDASRFTDEGIDHQDLFFFDGSTPCDDLVDKFLKICEDAKGAIAVHCKAGLGRTGSMIACYLMKWYRFSAREAIAWLRICRPASIIGHQQEWLESKEQEMWWRGRTLTPPKHTLGIYSLCDRETQPLIGKQGKTTRKTRTCVQSNADTLSRITDRVTTMSIESVTKDVNKNCVVPEEQGDRLNRIKLTRLSTRPGSKPMRTSWPLNTVNGSGKRTSSLVKLNQPRRNIPRNSRACVSLSAKVAPEESLRSNGNVTVAESSPDLTPVKPPLKQSRKVVR